MGGGGGSGTGGLIKDHMPASAPNSFQRSSFVSRAGGGGSCSPRACLLYSGLHPPPPSEITVHRKSVPKPRGCCINSPHSLKSAAEEAGGGVPPAETAPVTELTYQIRKTDSDKD